MGEEELRKNGIARITTISGTRFGADYVSLHDPGDNGECEIPSAERLAMIEPGAWLVNTARGAVVDEALVPMPWRRGNSAARRWTYSSGSPMFPWTPGTGICGRWRTWS